MSDGGLLKNKKADEIRFSTIANARCKMRDLPAAFLKHLDNNKSWIGPRPVSADDADKLEVTSANWHQTHGKGGGDCKWNT